MKRFLAQFLILCSLALSVSCLAQFSPDGVVEKYAKGIVAQKYSGLEDLFMYTGSKEDIADDKRYVLAMIEIFFSNTAEHGGVVAYEIGEVTYTNESNTSAVVPYTFHFANGTSENFSAQVVWYKDKWRFYRK